MPTTGIVEKEPIQRRPRPVCEHRDQSTGGKLLRNIRKRNLDDAHPIDRGRDGDRELISRQLSINLNLKRSTFLAEAPGRQRAAWEAQTDASVFCELLRSRGVPCWRRYLGDAITTNGISSLMRKAIMSRAMLSPGRIPASKRSATISTMPRSTETSTLISGYNDRKRAITGARAKSAAGGATVKRSKPAGLERNSLSGSSAAR